MTNQEFIESISLEGEIWKDVIEYEGLYMVSSYGRVVSLERNVKCPLNGVRHIQNRIISNNIDKKGYLAPMMLNCVFDWLVSVVVWFRVANWFS